MTPLHNRLRAFVLILTFHTVFLSAVLFYFPFRAAIVPLMVQFGLTWCGDRWLEENLP